ncbi:MAG: hypothetical protein AAFW46_06550 [Pseudomonadota bacterium]
MTTKPRSGVWPAAPTTVAEDGAVDRGGAVGRDGMRRLLANCAEPIRISDARIGGTFQLVSAVG